MASPKLAEHEPPASSEILRLRPSRSQPSASRRRNVAQSKSLDSLQLPAVAADDSASLPIDAPARRRLPILLRHAWFSLNQAFRRRIAHTGVTPDQFTTLRTLEENTARPPTQSELTRLLASDPNTIASLLERMAAAGWIARAPDKKDRRALRITLLPEGRKKYLEVRKIAVQLQTDVLAGWPEARREEFLENLQTIADRCRSSEEPGKKITSQ